MPTAPKKTTSKPSSKTAGTSAKSHTATHPTWVDMIKECIVAHPEDARTGVSRPLIKKFVETKYHIDVNALAASQLSRAITTGSEKGIFVLPKGPSGKVKLAPQVKAEVAKENTKPATKKPTVTKPKAPVTMTKKATTSRRVTQPKATTTTKTSRPATQAASARTAKYTSASKKSVATKKRTAAGRKATTAKRGAAKRTATRPAKKPAVKSKTTKGKPTAAKAKASPKATKTK